MTMTTEPRRRPAAASRVLAAGLATASTLGLTGAMALAGQAEQAPATVAAEAAATTRVVIVRRVVASATPAPRAVAPPPPRSRTRGS